MPNNIDDRVEELDIYKYALKLHSKGRSLTEVLKAIQTKRRYGDRIPDSEFNSVQSRINTLYS